MRSGSRRASSPRTAAGPSQPVVPMVEPRQHRCRHATGDRDGVEADVLVVPAPEQELCPVGRLPSRQSRTSCPCPGRRTPLPSAAMPAAGSAGCRARSCRPIATVRPATTSRSRTPSVGSGGHLGDVRAVGIHDHQASGRRRSPGARTRPRPVRRPAWAQSYSGPADERSRDRPSPGRTTRMSPSRSVRDQAVRAGPNGASAARLRLGGVSSRAPMIGRRPPARSPGEPG